MAPIATTAVCAFTIRLIAVGSASVRPRSMTALIVTPILIVQCITETIAMKSPILIARIVMNAVENAARPRQSPAIERLTRPVANSSARGEQREAIDLRGTADGEVALLDAARRQCESGDHESTRMRRPISRRRLRVSRESSSPRAILYPFPLCDRRKDYPAARRLHHALCADSARCGTDLTPNPFPRREGENI